MHPVHTALLCSCAEDPANFGLARRGRLRGPAAIEQQEASGCRDPVMRSRPYLSPERESGQNRLCSWSRGETSGGGGGDTGVRARKMRGAASCPVPTVRLFQQPAPSLSRGFILTVSGLENGNTQKQKWLIWIQRGTGCGLMTQDS